MNPRKTAHQDLFVPNPELRLEDQVHEVMRFHHYSHRTEEVYWHWIKRFMQFHRQKATPHADTVPGRGGEGIRKDGWRHPKDMGPAEVSAFLSQLATGENAAKATQQQALELVES